MKDFNKIILVGRVGKDPILNKNTDDTPTLTFTLATNSYIKPGQVTTDWHNIRTYGKQAELCAGFLRKGELCYVEGEICHYTIETDTGVRYVTEILARRLTYLTKNTQPEKQPTGKHPTGKQLALS